MTATVATMETGWKVRNDGSYRRDAFMGGSHWVASPLEFVDGWRLELVDADLDRVLRVFQVDSFKTCQFLVSEVDPWRGASSSDHDDPEITDER